MQVIKKKPKKKTKLQKSLQTLHSFWNRNASILSVHTLKCVCYSCYCNPSISLDCNIPSS